LAVRQEIDAVEVAFLAFDRASFITSSHFDVDGGLMKSIQAVHQEYA
jgi:hypothetical protein